MTSWWSGSHTIEVGRWVHVRESELPAATQTLARPRSEVDAEPRTVPSPAPLIVVPQSVSLRREVALLNATGRERLRLAEGKIHRFGARGRQYKNWRRGRGSDVGHATCRLVFRQGLAPPRPLQAWCAADVCRSIALGPLGLTHVTETAPQLPHAYVLT